MKWAIVRKSNYDRDDWRGDQWFAAKEIPSKSLAEKMCGGLNTDPHSEDYFVVVENDYQLPPNWEP